MTQPAILINLKRCTGCWTCSFACKVGNKVPDGKWLQYVRTIGGGGMDEPAGTWPDLKMNWMPIHTAGCSLCHNRTKTGDEPFCSSSCPTRAMTFGNIDDPKSPISVRMKDLKEMGYRVYQIPSYERTRPEIYYAEK